MNHTTKANGKVPVMLPSMSGNLHSSTQPYPTNCRPPRKPKYLNSRAMLCNGTLAEQRSFQWPLTTKFHQNSVMCWNSVQVIKSRRMTWAGHVARMGEAYTGFWWGNLRERDHWGNPGVDGRIILRWIFTKWDVGVWTGSSWLRVGAGGGHLWMR